MTNQLRLELPVLLPEIAHDADACVSRLVADLSGREGVSEAHVVAAAGDKPAQLCVHYDPDVLPLPRIRAIARAAGAALTQRFGHVLWAVDGLSHQRRARTVSERLRRMPGVVEADAAGSGPVRVEFDRAATSEAEIRRVLAEMDVRPRGLAAAKASGQVDAEDHDHASDDHKHGPAEADHGHAHGGVFGANTELYFALICGGLLGVGFAIDMLDAAAGWVPLSLYVSAYLFGGFYTVREAVVS